MSDTYFVISCSEDGDICISEYTSGDLHRALTGEGDLKGVKFFDVFEGYNSDPRCWSGNRLLIKGHVVVPRSVEVVTKYVVD